MALQVADRVKETTTTTGTGALALAGAMTGFRAFSAVCSVGDTVWYAVQAVDGGGVPTGDWEVGIGTYSAASTLTRTTVLSSSNAGAAVNFSAGTKQVWIDVPASRLAGSPFGAAEFPPAASDFSWVNQGSTAVASDVRGLYLQQVGHTTDAMGLLVKAKPAGSTWRVKARMKHVGKNSAFMAAGLCLRDSVSGKIIQFGAMGGYSSYQVFVVVAQNWASPTSFASDVFTPANLGVIPNWWSIRADGTNYVFEVSEDGINWMSLGQVAIGTYLTADQVGLSINAITSGGAASTLGLRVFSFEAS